MSLRDMVTGSDMCTASDGAGPSNAVGALVNQLLGGASKTQEQLRDLPMHHGLPGPSSVVMSPEAAAAAAEAAAAGMHHPSLPMQSHLGPAQLDAFFQGPRVRPGQMPQPQLHEMVSEFEQFRAQQGPQMLPGPPTMGMAPPLPGAPPPAVSGQLRAFLDSARSRTHFQGGPLPPQLAGLSPGQAAAIRDRATILARQLYAEQGEGFADQQVSRLLASLHIDPAALPTGLPHVHDAAWHDVWARPAAPPEPPPAELAVAQGRAHWEALWRERQAQAQQHRAGAAVPRTPSTGWADEFSAQHPAAAAAAPQRWADDFAAAQAPGQQPWAEEFAQQQAAEPSTSGAVGMAEGMASAKQLVGVLSSDADPKMRNSKFLQFLSKMSNGELIFEDNKVVERPAGDAWAQQFEGQQQQAAAGSAWADEFGSAQQQQQQQQLGPAGAARGDWADEFARQVADLDLNPGQEEMEAAWAALGTATPGGGWASEFERQEGESGLGDTSQTEWEALWDRHAAAPVAAGGAGGRAEYVFAADNPFLGDPQALAKGKDLFQRGLLSESVLALEAEVRAQPENAEAWRLLGTAHAENDDDRQAIAAMDKALAVGPQNLDVLLSLGVSHTNELDQGEALTYLARWLANHPQHSSAAQAAGPPQDSSQALSHQVGAFEAAARAAPADAELHMALGVLHHLGRRYDAAVRAFERALELRPQDYSLWNKLGATLANHNHSKEAIGAYQRALSIKPNYMRAWTNMGISYANAGDYETSARYYVRALMLNASASHVWGYLRTSLVCAGRSDLMAAVDNEDLSALQAVLPMA